MSNPAQLSEYRRTFLGSCLGVGLKDRGPDDNHVLVTILVEDDENWFESSGSFSSFWLPDLQSRVNDATRWIKQNCVQEAGGWRFKT